MTCPICGSNAKFNTCEIHNYYDDESLESLQEEVWCTPEDTFICKCTNCGNHFRYDRGCKPNFCPECGAMVVDHE